MTLSSKPRHKHDIDDDEVNAQLASWQQTGDDRALAALLVQFGRISRGRVGKSVPSADVDDVVQETLFGFSRALPSFKGDARLRTFHYRIERNKVADYHRRRRRKPESFDPDTSALIDPDDRSPLFEVAKGPHMEALVVAIERLPAAQREKVVLYFIDGLQTGEIAELLGVTSSTVSTAIIKARKALEAELGPDFKHIVRVDGEEFDMLALLFAQLAQALESRERGRDELHDP